MQRHRLARSRGRGPDSRFRPPKPPVGGFGGRNTPPSLGTGINHAQPSQASSGTSCTHEPSSAFHSPGHARLEVRQEAALGARCAARPPPGVHVADILPIHGLLPTKLTDPSHLRILSGLPMLKARAPGTKPAASKCGGPTEQPDRKIWTGSPLLPGLTVIRLRLRMQPHVIALSGRTMITYTRRDCKRWISCASGI